MSQEHNQREETVLAFVPRHLEINKRPELGRFPLNILFARLVNMNAKAYIASALYEPDFSSFIEQEKQSQMTYKNVYGDGSKIVIEYDKNENIYVGTKTVNNKSAGHAVGGEWKMFFVHLTTLGLTNGERCDFKEIEQT